MVTKSEDVRPTKRVPKKDPTVGEKEDINLKTNDVKSEMARVVSQYDEILKEVAGGKVWLKMERENMSFTSPTGIKFTKDNPYQMVDPDEVDILLSQNFRRAYPEEIKDFYDA